MAITDIDWGTVTLTNGSTTVTGSGTSWIADDIRDGDTFVFVDGGDGFQQPIVESVQSNTALTLREPWLGPTLSAVTYTLRYQWDSSRVSAMSRRLIMLLGSGNLEALAALTGPGVAVFNGPHSMEVRPFTDFVNGVRFDVQVDTLVDRDAYDGQVEGFAVLVSDTGDGRSAVFSKNTNTVADWSDAAYITGPVGDTGPYTDITVGPVTTLPYGQPASVDVVQVDPATIRLDFSIPKGQDGAGTGDVVGPSGAVDDRIAVFDGTTGKLIKDSEFTVSQLRDASNLNAGTLPDARVSATLPADKAFRRGNVLGTVFQSGGVPTGAIIERGANANGQYVKWADGTLICSFQSPATAVITSAKGALFHSGSDGAVWTYPAAFTQLHHAEMNTNDNILSHPIEVGLSSFKAQYWTVIAVSGYDAPITCFAIGKWF